ncbi:Glutathione transporter 1 [Hyphodiscus hymeniophilus]|uniref:Glutathione transporter 1 n=1 Tax=Hyphodiscus hymeniophilus TaxID=353542 RepID=A0A9P7AYL3_9HELO|nr:Glutathione transporter 1 [Hyphodiscus hymeniophilus]
MTSRAPSSTASGRQRDHVANDKGLRDIPLRPVASFSSLRISQQDDDEEELDPESPAALLRQHLRDSAESDDDAAQPTADSNAAHYKSPFQQLAGLMSKAPLLLRSAPGFGTGSYGAVPIGASTENSDEEDTEDRRKRRNLKHSGLRNGVSISSSRSLKAERSNSGISSSSNRKSRSRTPKSYTEEDANIAEDVGLEARYGVGGIAIPNDLGFDGAHGKDGESSSPASPEDASTEDDESTSDDEDPPDNSPYPQVRASVSATDNTALSINTPRLLWDQLLKRRDDPEEEFIDGARTTSLDTNYEGGLGGKLRHLRLWLAQGKWNEKEHSCVYISSNVSFGFAFATDVIVEQTHFYNQKVTIMYQLLLILSTQILGYSFAGLGRRILVRPGGMIWPGTLMSAAMFTTLHKEENTIANGWKISRWKFFFVVWFSAFLFYFIPGLLFPALSYFSIVTWFWPKNVVVANLFGVASGLGLFPVTFDWAQIAYIGSPLLTPFWAAMNVVGGLVLVMWIIAPIAYYSNVFFSSYMPILSSSVFDNTGHIYDVSKILTPDFLFDKVAYQNYSRVFLPITYVLSYGLQFAALASLLTHTACWHGKDIWKQWKRSLKEVEGETKTSYVPLDGSNGGGVSGPSITPRNGRRLDRTESNMDNIISQEDVHNRLMRRYKDAPLTWYLLTFVSMTAVGIFVVEYYPVHLPWYGLVLALGICTILFIPIGIVMAITNQHSSIYLICQLVCGAVFPGRPVANMVFVTYGYISSAQGVKFSADLKLGHYMKIPPRILFLVQMSATIVSSLTQIGVMNWMFTNVPNICTPQAINGFTCPLARVHFNGSILWGVVGPGEFFGPNATYHILVYCFPIGAVAPIILWLYARNRKGNIIRKINLPVLFGSLSWIPPATGLNFSVWALVCYIFNFVIRRRASAWWAKYTMTLSAALDSGLAFGVVVVFFGFVFPGLMDGFKWWGTEIYKMGCDWNACPYNVVPDGQHFGPDKW